MDGVVGKGIFLGVMFCGDGAWKWWVVMEDGDGANTITVIDSFEVQQIPLALSLSSMMRNEKILSFHKKIPFENHLRMH